MSNQEILTKAIQKAIDGGWDEYGDMSGNPNAVDYLTRYQEAPDTYTWLFDHDFAKALWGEDFMVDVEIHTNPFAEEGDQADVVRTTQAWKFHLKNMVIADDPIKYLGENI